MPRHDRAHGVHHSKKANGGTRAKRSRGTSNYKKRLDRRETDAKRAA